MDIRPAQAADLRGIQNCAKAAYSIYVPRIGKRPAPMVADFQQQISEGKIHVLADDRTIAGFAVFYRRDDHVHLENVSVHPEFQKLGFGVQLITHVEQFAADAGIWVVELYTNAKMTENLTLYPYLGYEEIGRWHEDGFDRVFFRKSVLT